jgi:DnaK suppressor protein
MRAQRDADDARGRLPDFLSLPVLRRNAEALVRRLLRLLFLWNGTVPVHPGELDQTSVGRVSRIDAIQGREMALATERRRKGELSKIDAALRRIDTGEYGYCVKCGEEIAEKRLALDPAAAACVKCA